MASPLTTVLRTICYYLDTILLMFGIFSIFIVIRYSIVQKILQHLSLLILVCIVLAVAALVLYPWYSQYIRGGTRRCTSNVSLKGKTVIITGGNSGIGKGAAIELATRGARVIIACRNVQRAEIAVKEIQERSENKNVEFRKLDLSSFKSVREFADRINQEEDRLDILINNAGIPDTIRGNSGIGKGAAIELATRGARVIIACRNVQRAEIAVKEIQERSENKNVEFRKLDLSSFKSVREFADRINQEEDRLDILINNAGIPDTIRGNSGIGKGAAIELATRGARVIIACRNVQRAEIAVKEIQERSENKNVEFRKLDLSSFKSVREFADRINQEEDRLDILINNAGIPDTITHDENMKPLPTEDGLSQSFQINHFSHFLLTNLLLDLLKKSAPSRVVNVSSRASTASVRKLDFTEGDGEVRYPKLTYYIKGKLANILFTKEFARRMDGTGVTSYAVYPGIVFTSIWEKQIVKWKVMAMSAVFWLLFCDEISGAQTTVHCSIEDGLQSGQVYFDCRPSKLVNPMVKDVDLGKQLWDVSLNATKLKQDNR